MMDRPVVAVKKCRFQGEAVAAVAAECDDAAMEALERIHVEYEELPGVYDPETAVSSVAPTIHEEMMRYQREKGCHPVEGTNICHHFKLRRGNIEEAFSKAHSVFEDRYTSHAVHHAPLEVHAAMAQMSGERLSVWTHNDAPYRCRRELAGTFRLPMTQLRIISLPMGGGFGG